MWLISYFLILLSLFFYIKRQKGKFVFCLLSAPDFFNLIESKDAPVPVGQLMILVIFVISIIEFIHDRQYFSNKTDKVGKIISLLFLFSLFHCLGSMFFAVDDTKSCLLSALGSFVFLMYFYLRKMDKKDFEIFFKLLLFFSIVQGVLFYLQLFDINLLFGRVDEATIESDVRYCNSPRWAIFFILYFMFNNTIPSIKRFMYLIFFLFMPLLNQSRSSFVMIAIGMIAFFMAKKKMKYVLYIIGGVIFYQIFVASMFANRTKDSGLSTFDEVKMVLTNPAATFDNYMYEDNQGTFAFRIGMIVERAEYIVSNPQYLLFGVGDVTEQHNKHYFQLGTYSKELTYGRNMLSSVDTDWVSIVIRLGLVGTILYIVFISIWLRKSFSVLRLNNSLLPIVSAAFSFSIVARTFTNSYLQRYLFITLIVIATTVVLSKKEPKIK